MREDGLAQLDIGDSRERDQVEQLVACQAMGQIRLVLVGMSGGEVLPERLLHLLAGQSSRNLAYWGHSLAPKGSGIALHLANGRQVLLSETTTALVIDDLPGGVELRDLGHYPLKGLERPENIHQLVIEGIPSEHPPLGLIEDSSRSRSDLPEGTVTFLFTDIEGSTRMWDRNPKRMKDALERHNLLVNEAIAAHGGRVFKIIGDEFQAAFTQPLQAVEAALAIQRALLAEDWGELGPLRVRMGVHVGPGQPSRTDYESSHTLNRVARICAAGHGGQILISHVAADMVRGLLSEGVQLYSGRFSKTM